MTNTQLSKKDNKNEKCVYYLKYCKTILGTDMDICLIDQILFSTYLVAKKCKVNDWELLILINVISKNIQSMKEKIDILLVNADSFTSLLCFLGFLSLSSTKLEMF